MLARLLQCCWDTAIKFWAPVRFCLAVFVACVKWQTQRGHGNGSVWPFSPRMTFLSFWTVETFPWCIPIDYLFQCKHAVLGNINRWMCSQVTKWRQKKTKARVEITWPVKQARPNSQLQWEGLQGETGCFLFFSCNVFPRGSDTLSAHPDSCSDAGPVITAALEIDTKHSDKKLLFQIPQRPELSAGPHQGAPRAKTRTKTSIIVVEPHLDHMHAVRH